MVRNIDIACSFIISILCSCCKSQYEQGSLQPEWETIIPMGTSKEIFYGGLTNLPKYKDLIIAHTTIRDDGIFAEDNRLCAVNERTGEVVWCFPDDLDNERYCHFDSKAYLYKGKVVFEYAKNYRDFSSRNIRTDVCLDVNNGKVLWEIDGVSPHGPFRPAEGLGNTCFFAPDSCSVCKVDLDTDKIQEFYNTGSRETYINDILLCDKYLVVSCCGAHVEEYMFDTSVVIVDITTGQEVFSKELERSTVPSQSYLDGDVLFSVVDTYLAATNIKTGETLWDRDDRWTYTLMDLHIYKDVILKCAGNATTGYDKRTGQILYDYRNYGSYDTSKEGRYAYLVNCKNIVDILDIETGQKLDKIVCPYGEIGFFGSYPAIYDNKLYIMGENRLFRYPTYPWN